MKRENIFISENRTAKRVAATKFIAPSDVPAFDCLIRFGKEENDVTMQNCNIKDSAIVKCSPDDAYDFEIGALIALMKMCGVEKVTKACDELYKDDNYKNALQEMTEKCEKLIKENEKLQHEYDLCKNSERALKCSVDYLNKTIAKLNISIDGYKEDLYKATKRCEELEIKESILNKQEETINKKEEKISVYFGGRGCGKQYKALVELFKKLDQKKVDAAYKEAYNTKLPLWQKEVLNQMYGVYKESKEKIELPRTLDINGTVYRKSIQIKDFSNDQLDSLIEGSRAFTRKFDNEWYYKPPTKREEMWENILSASKCPPVEIKVAKQDVTSFLRELQDKIPEARWNGSDCPPFEYTNPYWFKHDYIYFALFRNDDKGNLRMCYDEKPHSWINKPVIEYIAPMRWDLFEKGRKIVRVTPENIDEFIVKCTNKFGSIMKPVLKRYKDFTHIFVMISDYHYDNKPTVHIMTPEDLVRNQHENPKKYSDKKIVDWEDVR